jgi:polysaccharide deacetylase 2 family uncharacterized protein YibQ
MGLSKISKLAMQLIDCVRKEKPAYIWLLSGGIVLVFIVSVTLVINLRTLMKGTSISLESIIKDIPKVKADAVTVLPPKFSGSKQVPLGPAIASPVEDLRPYGDARPEYMLQAIPLAGRPIEAEKSITSLVLVTPGLENTWQKNAVQSADISPGPQIAIVIDDAGLDRKRTAAVIALPAPVTIAFLTYGHGLPEQVKKAREAGHEIMVHISMEPRNKLVDPGPNVLLTQSDETEILKRLRWGLGRFSGYVGINNHMGSRFTSDPIGMAIVMRELKRRGLLFLDSRTIGSTVGPSIALANDVPFTQRNIFLDNVPTVEAVNKQLQLTEVFAKRTGYAVAIGHPRDATITALSQWLAVMAERGFIQVPISTIVARQRPK